MHANPYMRTIDELSRLVQPDDLTDAECLGRYVLSRDGHAFGVLVRRHGPMVFGVCQRVLTHQQDAEDAFQAVFLVLARKAATVRPPEALSRWLYGVAVRVAHKARARRAKQQTRFADFTDDVPAPPSAEANDWRPLLDRALLRLSERDREPVLLCDVLGQSRAEAATALGIPEGTLSSRLARSRDKLRQQLTRLGVVPTVLGVATFVGDSLSAVVPNRVLETTVAMVPQPVASRLAEGVLRTMFLTKFLKWTVFFSCLCAAVGVGWQVVPTVGADPEKPIAKKDEPRPTDEDRIQGTWFVERVTTDGKNEPAGDHPWLDTRVHFVGNRFDFSFIPGKPKTFTLNDTTSPKHITFELHNRPTPAEDGNLQRLPSIYKLEDGKLYLTLGVVDFVERPTSFDWAETKPPYIHLVLRRPTKEETKTLTEENERLLQGTWIAAALEHGGQREILFDKETLLLEKVPADVVKKLPRMIFENDTLQLYPDTTTVKPLPFTFRVDATVAPRHLTLTATDTDLEAKVKKGQVLNSIYDYSRGILRVTLPGPPGDERPKSFDTKGTKSSTLYMIRADEPLKTLVALKELVAQKEPPPPPKTTSPLVGSWSMVAKEIDGVRTELKEVLTPRMLFTEQGLRFFRTYNVPLDFSYTIEGDKIDLRVVGQYREMTEDGKHRVFLNDQHMPGLFAVKDDELRITLAAKPDGDRPSALDSKKSGLEVLVFRRDGPEYELLRGKNWQLVEGEIDPKAVLNASNYGATLTSETFDSRTSMTPGVRFDGGHIRLSGSPQMPYVLRTNGKTKEIDIIAVGPGTFGNQGTVAKGIYQLKDGELIMCFPRVPNGAERPTSFEVKKTPNIRLTFTNTSVAPPMKKANPVAPPTPSKVQNLRQERLKVLTDLRAVYAKGVEAGHTNLKDLASLDAEIHTAALELAVTAADRITVCEANVKRLQEHEKLIEARVKEGIAPVGERERVKANRLKAEIELEEMKQQSGPMPMPRPTTPKGRPGSGGRE